MNAHGLKQFSAAVGDFVTGMPMVITVIVLALVGYLLLTWNAFLAPDAQDPRLLQDLWERNCIPGIGGAIFALCYSFRSKEGLSIGSFANWGITFAVCSSLFVLDDGWNGWLRNSFACFALYALTFGLIFVIGWLISRAAGH